MLLSSSSRVSGGRLGPRLLPAVVALAASAVGLAGGRAGAGVAGDPSRTGVLAVDCVIRLVDESARRTSEITTRPWLVRVDRPRTPIAPTKKGRLFIFAGLEPGTYRLDGAVGVTSRTMLHEKRHADEGFRIEDIVDLRYNLEPDARRLVTVAVAPGDVYYLGRVTIFDAIHQEDEALSGDVPPLRLVLDRRLADAVKAFDLMARAGRGSVWEGRLVELSRTVRAAAVRDTTLESEAVALDH